MKVVAISQARMSSTRLPGKVMMRVLGRTLLDWHISRVRRAKNVDQVIVASTTNPADDALCAHAAELGAEVFRGPEDDVLARYVGAADKYDADVVVRVTSDCPLIDPAVIDDTIVTFLSAKPRADYGCNRLPQTYPRGMDTEVLWAEALREAYHEAQAAQDREHVTLFLWRQPDRYRLVNAPARGDHSRLRWTVDTPEDYVLVRRLIEGLAPSHQNFTLDDCLAFIARYPELEAINQHIEQKKVL
jgi:spore coat polysaccharide biosynthesis protein SpsF